MDDPDLGLDHLQCAAQTSDRADLAVITQRILIGISLKIVSGLGVSAIMTCAALAYELRDDPDQLAVRYPLCPGAADPYAVDYAVSASFDNDEGVAAAFIVVATPMLWLAIFIHAALAELWIGYQRGVAAAAARDLPISTSSDDVKA